MSLAAFGWALVPAIGFFAGRSLPFPGRTLRTPLAAGLLVGLLVASVRGMRLGATPLFGFEETGALVFIFVLGASTMRWTVRPDPEAGRDAATHGASFALLAAAGAVASIGGAAPAVMLPAGLAIGLGSGIVLTRLGAWWAPMLWSLAAFVAPALAAFAAPERAARVFLAFAAGALAGVLFLARWDARPREWPVFVGAALFALGPWLFA